jgi:putative endopeptidase
MGLFSFTQEIAMDLGTANTIITTNGKIVVDEPSVVALDRRTDKMIAVGDKNFDERAQVMVNFFDSIEVAPGVYANGRMTLGENIADHGGLQVSYQAFKKATAANPLPVLDGLTPEQRFFLAYAGVWANDIRPEEVLNRTKSDVHSLGEWRVNGALPQIGAWYEAFNVTEKDPMFLPVEKRVSIW